MNEIKNQNMEEWDGVAIPGTEKELIKDLIQSYGLSEKNIADAIGVVPSMIHRFRQGEAVIPNIRGNLAIFYLKNLLKTGLNNSAENNLA